MGARGSCTPSRLHGAPHRPHTGPPLHHCSTSLGRGSGARDSRPGAQPVQGAPGPTAHRAPIPAAGTQPGPPPGLGSLGACG